MEYWHKEFIYAQDRISDIPGNDYYSAEYRHHEPWYSMPIIRMLFEDTVTSQVKPKNILDIGCGWGAMALYAQRIYGNDVFCIDMEKREIPLDRITFHQANIEFSDLPQKWPDTYERIIMTEVLEHFRCNPVPTLKKIVSRMGKDSILYLSTPNACDPQWGRITKYYKHIGEMPDPDPSVYIPDEHVYQYTEGEILFLLNKAGLKVELLEKFSPPFWGQHLCIKAIKE